MKKMYAYLAFILVGLFIVFTTVQLLPIYFIFVYAICLAALVIAYILLTEMIKSFLIRNGSNSGDIQDITDVTLYLNEQSQDTKSKENQLRNNEKIYLVKNLVEQSINSMNSYNVKDSNPGNNEIGSLAPTARPEKESFSQNLDSYFDNLKDDLSEIKENAAKVYNISDNITQSAEVAMGLSRNVKQGILAVTKSLADSLTHSETLFNQSQKIGEILELIADIASKTNVLSINASIVSARVGGKDGQAFGVVAREIRNLATETEKSLSQIEIVIKDIQNRIRILAENIKISESQSRQEMDAILQVAGSLQGIVLGVEVVRTVSVIINEKTSYQNDTISAYSNSSQKIKVEIENLNLIKGAFSEQVKNHITNLQKAISLLEEQLFTINQI